MRSLLGRLLLGSSATLMAGCFTGSDAFGLPCEVDDDCGRKHECIGGFCGGAPGTTGTDTSGGSCGDSIADPGEECDEGPADTATCDADCTMPSCGDGYQNEAAGEQCDEGDGNGGEICTTSCTLASCGNGVMDPGEDCDGNGIDTPACDANCSSAECGDGYVNAAAGEDCEDSNPALCQCDCSAVYFFDDFEIEGMWSHAVVEGTDATDTWNPTQNKQVSGSWSWQAAPPPVMSSGTARLSTIDAIDLTRATGTVELRFSHWYEFDACDEMFAADGGIIEIAVGAGPFEPVMPENDYPVAVLGEAGCETSPNPLADEPGYGGNTMDMWRPVLVNLAPYVGQTIRIGFTAGWDCNDCNMVEGWFLDDVIVAGPEPMACP